MTPDPLDDFLRGNFPAPDLSPERVDRLIGSVMARLDREPAPRRWPQWLAALVPPVTRFALPMAAAAVLGVMVGHGLNQAEPLSVFSQVFLSTSFLPVGS